VRCIHCDVPAMPVKASRERAVMAIRDGALEDFVATALELAAADPDAIKELGAEVSQVEVLENGNVHAYLSDGSRFYLEINHFVPRGHRGGVELNEPPPRIPPPRPSARPSSAPAGSASVIASSGVRTDAGVALVAGGIFYEHITPDAIGPDNSLGVAHLLAREDCPI